MRFKFIIFLILLFPLFFGSLEVKGSTNFYISSNTYDTLPDGMVFKQFFYNNGKLSSEGYLLYDQPEGVWKNYDEQGFLVSQGARKNYQLDGIWKFYQQGKLKSEIAYFQNKKNGLCCYYSEDKKIIENYIYDTLQGLRQIYDTNGALIKTTNFIHGLENGLEKEYNSHGDIALATFYKDGLILWRQAINKRDKENRKQGIWKSFYPSDVLYWEVSYVNDLKEGYYKEYDTLGNIVRLEKYHQGELEKEVPELAQLDIYTEYFTNGKLKFKVGYKNGKPEGICRQYDSITGKIVKGLIFKNGVIVGGGIIDENGYFQDDWKEYYPDGKLRCDGKYKKGQRYGLWRYYYPDGSIEQEGEYKNGKYDGRWIWYYPGGNIRLQQEYYRGQLDGESLEYDENQHLIAFGKYIEGLEEGTWEYVQGEERLKGNYKQGERNGLWKHYWKQQGNQLSFQGFFVDGLPHGRHIYYWDNGRIREENIYSMGRRTGTWTKYDENGDVIVHIRYNQDQEEERYNSKRTLDKPINTLSNP
ncbi:MAG: hypothetical protein RRX93_01690 [Bacteroidales bacterium]